MHYVASTYNISNLSIFATSSLNTRNVFLYIRYIFNMSDIFKINMKICKLIRVATNGEIAIV